LTDKELSVWHTQVNDQRRRERIPDRFGELGRIARALDAEGRRRTVDKAIRTVRKLQMRYAAGEVMAVTEVVLKGVSVEGTIPLEQIKGDIARQGYQIDRVIALDPEARRLFFSNTEGGAFYAEFGPHATGFALQRVGLQADISKEYDPIDLDDAGVNVKVTTEHDERKPADDTPGMVPAGVPGEKPKGAKVTGEEGDPGWGAEVKKALLTKLDEILR
jgi:hypothetical protein